MKLVVSKEMKVGAALAVVVMAIAIPVQASAGVIFLLAITAITVYGVIDMRPAWLRRGPLGRWIRRQR